MSGPVRAVDDGAVRRLRLDRPDRRNALDEATRAALAAELDRLDDDRDVRVVVLEGAGPAFSAGADLGGAYDERLGTGDWAERRHLVGTWQRLLEHLGRIPQVTVARLHGHVVGGAALLAAACDLRVAGEGTVVRIPELALGIPLTWAGVPLLAREVGLPRARDWVLTGRPVAAPELLASGFATRVVADADLDAALDDLVATLVATPAAPLAMTRSLTAALGRQADGMVAAWADPDLLMWSFREPESQEAARAYGQALRDRRRST